MYAICNDLAEVSNVNHSLLMGDLTAFLIQYHMGATNQWL